MKQLISAAEIARRKELVDLYASVKEHWDAAQQLSKAERFMREEIESWNADKPVTEGYTVEGARFRVKFGPRKWERTITSMGKLYRLLKLQKFLSLCSFAVGKIDALVEAGELRQADADKLLSKEQTGSRKVEAIEEIEQAGKAA